MRLSKIVTRTGDNGMTGLGDGSRISKASVRMDTIGDIDELNSYLGLVRAKMNSDNDKEFAFKIKQIQNRLFDLGGELSIPDYQIIDSKDVDQIELITERINADYLSYLENFILPGGSELVSHIHVARAIARRAERSLVRLDDQERVNPEGIKFLNRISDFLFVLARYHSRGKEVLWQPKEKPSA